jgi:hypothetical protein
MNGVLLEGKTLAKDRNFINEVLRRSAVLIARMGT